MHPGDYMLYLSLFVSLFFEVVLLITYLEVREELKFEKAHVDVDLEDFPSVTIMVPCFNEEQTVGKTVLSLLDLDYPKEKLSLVLIDDGSTDKTFERLQTFKNNPQIRILQKRNGGKHTALNLGLENINSDLVGCLDADSFVDRLALKKIAPYFVDQSVMAVTPSVKVYEPKTFLQHLQKVEYSWGIFLRRMLSSLNAIYVTPGPFSIFRTRVFKELGGYRVGHKTEDMEIAMRMQKNHYKIVNSHSAHVYTVAPAKLKSLYKQRVRWTYGFLNNVIDYREMLFNKKYGNIGLFILPIATFSIFSTLYATARVAYSVIAKASSLIAHYQSTGLTWHFAPLNWFFLNTGTLTFVITTAILFSILIIFLSLHLAEGRARLTKGVVYYLTIYAFIVPFWLLKASYSTIVRQDIAWR